MTREWELSGILTPRQLCATAEHIAALQRDDGLIPWFSEHHADPWDHVEAAMALAACGHLDAARRAYLWSAAHQRPDGTWPMQSVGDTILHGSADANQCAYIAVGVWHYWTLTGDRRFVTSLWPTVRTAIGFVVALQRADGAVCWSRDPAGEINPEALLTGSACLVLSLRCALALAELLGDRQPDWELAVGRLAHTVAVHPERFKDQSRFAMDWYYPVLGGAVRGEDAAAMLERRWHEFVVPGRGSRCVTDQPWVTAAETCELAIALDAAGQHDRAWQLMRDVQFLRVDDEGGYWTGWVAPEGVIWPAEQTTWTSAAMILAADVLAGATAAHGLFRGETLLPLVSIGGCDDECLVPVR